jgi:hypothetical protein
MANSQEATPMSDPVEQTARAAARRLAAEHARGLPIDVEAALHARGSVPRPDQYLDPVSLAGLIVSAASLAWTVYADLKTRTAKPAPEVVARAVRVRLEHAGEHEPAERDHIIEIVVDETVQSAEKPP